MSSPANRLGNAQGKGFMKTERLREFVAERIEKDGETARKAVRWRLRTPGLASGERVP